MKPVPLGAKGISTLMVGPDHLARKFDPILPEVLSTPSMLLVIEMACMEAIRPYFDEGETSVGGGAEVSHLAPTPPGQQVRAEAEIVKVEGRRIEFKAQVFDETGLVGSGSHRRTVVNLATFKERLGFKPKS